MSDRMPRFPELFFDAAPKWAAEGRRAEPGDALAQTGHVTRSMFDRYNIISEDDLRLAAQKTNIYVDTLPTKRVHGHLARDR